MDNHADAQVMNAMKFKHNYLLFDEDIAQKKNLRHGIFSRYACLMKYGSMEQSVHQVFNAFSAQMLWLYVVYGLELV